MVRRRPWAVSNHESPHLSSFETYRFAMLLRMRIAAEVSTQEGKWRILKKARQTTAPSS
jgi:hypothetical protein